MDAKVSNPSAPLLSNSDVCIHVYRLRSTCGEFDSTVPTAVQTSSNFWLSKLLVIHDTEKHRTNSSHLSTPAVCHLFDLLTLPAREIDHFGNTTRGPHNYPNDFLITLIDLLVLTVRRD